MEDLVISDSVLNSLKKAIDRNQNKTPKPKGYSQAQNFYSTERMSKGAAAKLKTEWESQPKEDDVKEKINTLGKDIYLYAVRQLAHEKNKEDMSAKIRTGTSHPTGTQTGSKQGRTVDRLNNPSSGGKASVRPPTPPSVTYYEEVKRFFELL